MKGKYLLFLIGVLLSGCKAFKPSADLGRYAAYFAPNTGNTRPAAGQVKITFFGTSTLLFDDGQTQLLIDGFFSRPPVGKVAFGKVKSDTALIRSVIGSYNINRLRAVFVCHSHYDHAMDAPAVCKMTGARLYGSASTLNVGKGQQLCDSAMQLYEPGKPLIIGNFSVVVINSKHTPPFKLMGKTNATDPNHPDITKPLKQPAKVDSYIEGGTYDFYIKHGEHTMLVKASTNYMENALDAYPAEVLFLGSAMLGLQPEKFMQNYYRQTVQATGAKLIIPIHWDNFTRPLAKPLVALPNLTDNVNKGFEFLMQQSAQHNVKFNLMQGGTSIILF